jgi:cytochrome c oxidase subunit 4
MRVVVVTGAVLLTLWALSFGLSYLRLGAAAVPVALGVAVVKAALVVLFFMELRHQTLSMKLAFLAGAALLSVCLGLVLADVVTREPPPLAPFGSSPGRPAASLPSR